MQNSTRASRTLARTGSPSGARRATKTSIAASVSLLFCRFSAWASRFITFKVNFSILSPHLSRRLMRNRPCAGASVRAGSVRLCNLNSIQHSPLSLPCLHDSSLQMPKKVTLISDKNTSQKRKKKTTAQQVAYNIFTSLLSACFVILTPRARHSNVKPARFYFKILGRGGENSKRLRSYLLPSRIQDHRS